MLTILTIGVSLYIVFDLLMERRINNRIKVIESVVAALLIDLSDDLVGSYEFDED